MANNFTLQNSTVTITNQNNNASGSRLKTHDISDQIAGNPGKTFTLDPTPIPDTLIVSLDGLILRLQQNVGEGDYTYSVPVLTLLVDNLEDDSVLLAIYEEA